MACCKSLITSTISSACKIVQIDQMLTEKWFVSASSALQCFKSWTWAFSRLLPPFKPYSRARYLVSDESVQLHFSCCSQYFIIFLIAPKLPFTDYKLSWKCLKRTNLAIVIDCASVVPSTVRTGTWYFNLPFILALVQVFCGIVIVGFFGNDNQEVFGLCKILAEGV